MCYGYTLKGKMYFVV